jgi:hypothetical protein
MIHLRHIDLMIKTYLIIGAIVIGTNFGNTKLTHSGKATSIQEEASPRRYRLCHRVHQDPNGLRQRIANKVDTANRVNRTKSIARVVILCCG